MPLRRPSTNRSVNLLMMHGLGDRSIDTLGWQVEDLKVARDEVIARLGGLRAQKEEADFQLANLQEVRTGPAVMSSDMRSIY